MATNTHIHIHHGGDHGHGGHGNHHEMQDLLAKLMATLQEAIELARRNTTVIGSINVLLDGLRERIAGILSGAITPPAVQAKVDEAFAELTAQGTELDEVLLENTPQEPPPGGGGDAAARAKAKADAAAKAPNVRRGN